MLQVYPLLQKNRNVLCVCVCVCLHVCMFPLIICLGVIGKESITINQAASHHPITDYFPIIAYPKSDLLLSQHVFLHKCEK